MEGAIEIEDLKTRSVPLKARMGELHALLAEIDEPSVVTLHPSAAMERSFSSCPGGAPRYQEDEAATPFGA
jgi:hypothetical protein